MTGVRESCSAGALFGDKKKKYCIKVCTHHHDGFQSLFQRTMSKEAQALFEAAGKGDINGVKKLLEFATPDDKNFQSDLGETALTLASLRGHLAVVDILINAGLDLEKKNKTGTNALMWASREGHVAIVKRLIAAGANMNSQDNQGSTSLMVATSMGRKSIVEVFINAGADIDIRNGDGTSVFILAAFLGHSAIVDYLIRSGVNIEQQNGKGYTALMMASKEGYKPTVEVLLKAGANMDARGLDRKTALDVAKNEDMKKLLRAYARSNFFGGMLPAMFGGKKVASPQPVVVPSKSAATFASSNATSPPVQVAASKSAPAPASTPTPAPAAVVSVAQIKQTTDSSFLPLSNEKALAGPVQPAQDITRRETQSQPAEFTEQDKAALNAFFKSSVHNMISNDRLYEMILTVTAHEKALHTLVNKKKECPALYWFYPKKRELRNWLSNPAKCLFQDTLMMVVVCPVTLCVVECGPKGVGWEITVPKQWVKKWGPAIMFSIYVMQTAVLAGRVVGIPLPQLPSASNLTGLSTSAFGLGVDDVFNQENMMDCLGKLADTTASVLEQTPAMQRVCESIQQQGKLKNAPSQVQLAADMPQEVMDESYNSIHVYLTTGDNAKLGKLEDQLRGRMERIMAPNGDVEWVSVEGKDIWLEQRKHSSTTAVGVPPSINATKIISSTIAGGHGVSGEVPTTTWLAEKLVARGVNAEMVKMCEHKLIETEDFSTEEVLAALSPDEFNTTYLAGIGISAKGLQVKLVSIHKELHAQYNHPPTAGTPPPPPVADEDAASLSKDEKAAFLKMQDTVQSLTSQLSKLRAAAGNSNGDVDVDVSVGGGGGGSSQLLKKAQMKSSGAINPKTRQPYTFDDLACEVLRLNREIDNVASATDERLGNVEHALSMQLDDCVSAGTGVGKHDDDLENKKRSLFGH